MARERTDVALAFSAGREFTAGGLRQWAYRLGKTRKRARSAAAVRVARVVRDAIGCKPAPVPASDVPIIVEVGGMRVSLRAGFDRATLGAVSTCSTPEARDDPPRRQYSSGSSPLI